MQGASKISLPTSKNRQLHRQSWHIKIFGEPIFHRLASDTSPCPNRSINDGTKLHTRNPIRFCNRSIYPRCSRLIWSQHSTAKSLGISGLLSVSSRTKGPVKGAVRFDANPHKRASANPRKRLKPAIIGIMYGRNSAEHGPVVHARCSPGSTQRELGHLTI